MTIELARPIWLWLLLALPVWWRWVSPPARWSMRVARGADAAEAALPRRTAALLESAPKLLVAVAAALVVLALAGPQFVRTHPERIERGAAIAVALDLSTSMWAQDMAQGTTRLQAAKDAARGFVERRHLDEVGLVTFAGETHVRLPLTHDHGIVESAIDALEVGLLLDGTDVAGAIAVGADLLRAAPRSERMLILVTDGAHNRAGLEPARAARAAAAFGVRVYPIAIGSEAMLASAAPGMETVLTQAAEITGGRYYRAIDASALERIYAELDLLTTPTDEVVQRVDTAPVGHWLALSALLAWLAAAGLRASPWGVLP